MPIERAMLYFDKITKKTREAKGISLQAKPIWILFKTIFNVEQELV